MRRAGRVRARASPARAGVRRARPSRRSRSARRSRRATSSAARASTACIPATRSAATTRAWTTCCSSRSRRSGPPTTSTGSPDARGGVLMTEPGRAWRDAPLIFERSRAGRRAGRRAGLRPPEARASTRASSRASAAPSGARRVGDRSPHHGARGSHVRRRHRLLPARLLHDEAQPARQRARGPAARLPRPASAPGGRGRAGRARAHVAPARRSSRRSRGFLP